MAKKQLKVIHVELKEPVNGKAHYYFGSKKAIYDVLKHEEVGISYDTLRTKNITPLEPYLGRKATIRQDVLVTLNAKDNESKSE